MHWTEANSSLMRISDNDTLVTITNSGKMGIGTTTPGTLLELSSDSPYLTVHNTNHTNSDFGRNGELVFKGEQSGGEISKLGILKFSHDGTSDNENGRFEIKVNDGDDGNSPHAMLRIDENYGIAMGQNTTASYEASTAMGNATTANRNYSTAMGDHTKASGVASTAMGYYTEASENYSTAIGKEIKVSGDYSFGIALCEQDYFDVTKDSVMAIMGGKVGIGTGEPETELQVVGKAYATEEFALNPSQNVRIAIGGSSNAHSTNNADMEFQTDNDFIFRENDDQFHDVMVIHGNSGKVGIGTTNPQSLLEVNGGVKVANDTDAASASKVGTLRYRTDTYNSYVEMCMQTGPNTYGWILIHKEIW